MIINLHHKTRHSHCIVHNNKTSEIERINNKKNNQRETRRKKKCSLFAEKKNNNKKHIEKLRNQSSCPLSFDEENHNHREKKRINNATKVLNKVKRNACVGINAHCTESATEKC